MLVVRVNPTGMKIVPRGTHKEVRCCDKSIATPCVHRMFKSTARERLIFVWHIIAISYKLFFVLPTKKHQQACKDVDAPNKQKVHPPLFCCVTRTKSCPFFFCSACSKQAAALAASAWASKKNKAEPRIL